jgi:hypothetical protein
MADEHGHHHQMRSSRKGSTEELDLDAAPKFDHTMPFSIVIFGATGDLARKKLFPALYQVRQ